MTQLLTSVAFRSKTEPDPCFAASSTTPYFFVKYFPRVNVSAVNVRYLLVALLSRPSLKKEMEKGSEIKPDKWLISNGLEGLLRESFLKESKHNS